MNPDTQCTSDGPCVTMAEAIHSGAIVCVRERAATAAGRVLDRCLFCGSPLEAATVAAWPWRAFREMGGG